MEQDFCEYCGAELNQVEKQVTVYRHRQGQHFIFQQVPARVCSRCGERYFSAQVVREMDRLMQTPAAQKNIVQVPLIPFTQAT
jgi:YgiT-type zinc finger domain-containing protein